MVETQRRPRAMRGAAGGEVVEVQGGGHIVRATGRKDRHSKVCTAKGLRDRRVRLSAHTAIQFYDVQDRLGLDRPSKAVDWLIKNAKPSIDQLAQLPPWRPPAPASAGDHEGQKTHISTDIGDYGASAYGYCGSSSLLPPSLDSDSIADTIKSFFPRTAAVSVTTAASPSYPSALDLLSHGGGGGGGSRSHAEDLRLSLQSFQDPIFSHQQSRATPAHQALFSAPMNFDAAASTWPEPGQRAATWNLAEPSSADAGGSGGRYLFGLSSQLVQNQFATQWGTLQSSNPPLIRAMADPIALSSAVGHQMHLTAFRSSLTSPMPAYQNAAGDVVGFSGYHMAAARIHGGEEHDGAVGDAPPAASSALHR